MSKVEECSDAKLGSSLKRSFRKRKLRRFLAGLICVGVVLSVYFFEPIKDTVCGLTEIPRSWTKRSSSLRQPFRELWETWDSEDVAQSPAAQSIADIINAELSMGDSPEAIHEHIKRHFKDSEVENVGMFKVAYVEKAYGTQGMWPIGDFPEILQIVYYYGEALKYPKKKDGFIRAEILISRGKGSYEERFVIELGQREPKYVKSPY